MALSVKAYLTGDSDEQEIRRFSVDEGVSANYSYLVQKIESVFPVTRGKKINLFWKDSEDEMITFSTDEELVEALGSFGGDVFRVYVKIQNEGTTSQDQEAHSVHPGVVCDGCENELVGVRYKCTICPNFDLCAPCETKALHNHHEMIRIAIPRSNPWEGFQFSVPPHHPPPPGTPFEHPHGPWSFAWAGHGLGAHSRGGHGLGAHGRGGHGRGGHGRGGHGRGHHARGYRGGCGPFRGRGGRGSCSGPRGRCGNSAGAKCQRHDKNTADIPVGPPFLHNLGENIASFLAPFGVEVHTYADDEPVCCQGQCPPSASGADSNADPSNESMNQTDEEQGTAKPQGSCDDCSCPSDKKEEGSPEDFEFVDEDAQPSATSQEGVEVDPLEVAIAQMRAMGFEDDSGTGWLSQLIKSKNYDIAKVLDTIQYDGKH